MRSGRHWRKTALGAATWACCGVLASGCGGDARVDLAAAQAIDSLAANLHTALNEYHAEVQTADERRSAAVVSAFVARVQSAAGDSAALQAHAAEFAEAQRKLQADQQVEWERHHAAADHVTALRAISDGLREIALASLSLQDEARRYALTWLADARSPNSTKETP